MINDEFIAWAFGNTLDNTLRGVVAEFLVHKAVGGISPHRLNWDACDVEMQDGTKIEVKASGYLQSWKQEKASVIQFDISEKDPWLARENRFLGRKCRYSDIWVFAVHAEQDIEQANPLDASQWEFLVTTTPWLNETFPAQKSIRYSVLLNKGLVAVAYSDLPAAIEYTRSGRLINQRAEPSSSEMPPE